MKQSSLVASVKVFFFIFISSLLTLLFSKNIQAKDYSIQSANITVEIQKDGSAEVVEERTYNFSGSYSWADEWINLKAKCDGVSFCENYKISNFSISENNLAYVNSEEETAGTYNVSVTTEKLYVKWFYTALDETKTFNLKYTINNAVTNHSDISEFYWKIIGEDWVKPTGSVTSKIFLPYEAPSDQIWAFGHGPLNGKVNITSNKEINFVADNLSSKTFFEVRILLPKNESFMNARKGNSTLEKILAEENKFGRETKNQFYLGLFITLLLAILPIWRVIVWYKRWRKFGKDLPVPEVNLSGKLHEPPSDLHPIFVEALLNGNKVTGKSITATIIELARRKILSFERERVKKFLGGMKNEYCLILKDKSYSTKALNKYEEDLIDLIFDGKEKITFKEIKNVGRERPSETSKFWQGLTTKVKGELLALDFLDKEADKQKTKIIIEAVLSVILFFVLGTFVPAIGIALMGMGGIFLFLLIPLYIVCFIILILLAIFMDKRTEKGAMEYASWKAFREYLKDYSVTKNYPIDSVILWEKYLVYGTVLGISIKALSELPIKYSQAFERSGIYMAGFSSGNGKGFSSDFNSSFSNLGVALSSLSTSVSSSYGAHGVGSSGGFSGGGGGGGAG